MNRNKEQSMKDARASVIQDIERNELDRVEFNEEMISKDESIKILKFYEVRKLDVLSILSDPFKHHFGNKHMFVHGLAVEQAKIEDEIYFKYKHAFKLFLKSAVHYGLIKEGSRI